MYVKKNEEFIIVDIETTGLAPAQNEVIEIGAVRLLFDGKTFKQKGIYQTLIKPYKEIPANIQNLTGITPEMVAAAPRFDEVYSEFLDFLGDGVFVAHNVQFDLQMLNVNLLRIGGSPIINPTLDSQQLVAIAYPMLQSQKLGDVAKVLKINRGNGHRALDDAKVTAEVIKKVYQTMCSFNPAVLSEVNKLLQNHSWPFKDIFLKAYEKAVAGLSLTELNKARGWEAITENVLEFEKLKRPVLKQGQWREISIEQIDMLLDHGGALSKQFANYEYRKPQREMVSLVVQSLNYNEHVIIEAGTGTGKSIAYLLPAMFWAVHNGTPVVISTRTKNLQAQLIEKDVPLLIKVFKEPLNVLVLKGRENYVCLQRVEALLKRMLLEGTLEHIINVLPIVTWLSLTKTGDLSELHLSAYRSFNKFIKSEIVTCAGERCKLKNRCFLYNIRRQSKKADVIIVNHSLLFTDLAGENSILPEYKHLIIDEAHSIEEAVTESFSHTINAAVIIDELKRIGSISDEKLQNMVVQLRGKTYQFFEMIHAFVSANKKIAYDEEIQVIISEAILQTESWAEITAAFNEWQKLFKTLMKAVKDIEMTDEAKSMEVEAAKQNLEEFSNRIAFILDQKEPNYVRWLMANNASAPYNSNLCAAPIDIAPFIQEYVFEKKDSVVLTSATLTVADSFDYFFARLGFEPGSTHITSHALGSSFNYEEQLLFCVPEDFPAVTDEAFTKSVKDFFIDLFQVTQGRTLVLFTSYKMLQKVYNKVRIALEQKGLSILCQGKHGSRRAIINRFKENTRSILFGTDSFWEGVDIPGQTLSCVIMMKLPFAVPTEPVTAARLEACETKGKNAFFSLSIPQAVMKFKQGLGRLIRTHDDTGVVILLDNRILKNNYGKVFLKSIPGKEPLVIPAEDIIQKVKKWL